MGASEILKILSGSGELTLLEIAEKSEYSQQSVKKAIRRLIKDISEDIQFRILTPEEKETRYGHKLGCKIRIYWLNEEGSQNGK